MLRGHPMVEVKIFGVAPKMTTTYKTSFCDAKDSWRVIRKSTGSGVMD